MKVLKRFIHEAIAAGPAYMTKEKIRENIQNLVVDAVQAGGVKSQDELDEWWKTVEISIKSLRLIPFNIVKRM